MKTNETDRYFGKLRTVSGGKIACHICGKAFHNLANHIRNTHSIDPKEYRVMYGLNSGCSLCSESLSDKRRDIVNKYPELVEKLIKSGKRTQMQKGVATYTKDKVRRQASLTKKERELSPEEMKKAQDRGRKLGRSKIGYFARRKANFKKSK